MGYGSGFIEGLFGSVDKALQEDFRAAKAETSRLTSIRQARTAQRNDAREAKVSKTNEEIQALAGKIGPGAGIILNDFIQEGGLPYAKEATTKLINYTQKTGITPVEFYQLSTDELGKKPNPQFFDTLAQSAVPAVKKLGEPVTTASSIATYFGYGGPEAVKKQTEAGLPSISGTSVRDISGLGERRGGITDTTIPIQYSIKDEQIFNAKKSISLTEKLTDPNIADKEKAGLRKELIAVNNKIDANRKIQRLISPDKDPKDQYFRLINEGKTEEADALLQVIIRYNVEIKPNATTYGNSGAMTKAMVLGLPAFAAKKVGFDPSNPSRPVSRRVRNEVTGEYITDEIPGEQAEKEYRMELLSGYINYSNNLAVKSGDADAVSMRILLKKEIEDLRSLLEVQSKLKTDTSTAKNLSPVSMTGVDDLNPSASGTKPAVKQTDGPVVKKDSVTPPSPIVAQQQQQPKKMTTSFTIPEVNRHFSKNPDELSVYKERYDAVKNKPFGDAYDNFIKKLARNLRIEIDEAEGMAGEFEYAINEEPVATAPKQTTQSSGKGQMARSIRRTRN